jgi:hypothetical protein
MIEKHNGTRTITTMGESDAARKATCPNCGRTQIIKSISTIRAVIYVLMLPIMLAGMFLMPMLIQNGLATWLGKRTRCGECGETFETKNHEI